MTLLNMKKNDELPSKTKDEKKSQRNVLSYKQTEGSESKEDFCSYDYKEKSHNKEGEGIRKEEEEEDSGGRRGEARGGGRDEGEGTGGQGRGGKGGEVKGVRNVGHGGESKLKKTADDSVRICDLETPKVFNQEDNRQKKRIGFVEGEDLNSWAQNDISDLLDDADSPTWEVKGQLRLQEYDIRSGGKREVILTKEMEIEILGNEDDITCGFGCFRGSFLQRLARPEVYLLAFSMVALSKGVYYTYSTATISTIERRFNFPSKVSGKILLLSFVALLYIMYHNLI
ncbi:uncharacterized protein LOC143034833 [Oratosquilla oratoria]|uniref:uncharacterized protein LOC143034833 n=1 Tax=Oratosquilla oratoria TaxID=337810 RepID=UPI003F76D5CF